MKIGNDSEQVPGAVKNWGGKVNFIGALVANLPPEDDFCFGFLDQFHLQKPHEFCKIHLLLKHSKS